MSDALQGIAIVGMSGRFPGAENVTELWRNLVAGRESIERLSDEQLASAGLDASALKADPHYVPARGRIEKPEWFDAAFFGITPREAEVMDPQQRVFLEESWTALEDAGCDPPRYAGSIGVFAGMSNNTYFANNVAAHPELIEAVGQLTAMMANEKDYLATRVAYKLNLRGPALNIYTACSTSLVAVAQACTALLNFQCDAALAGGVSITFPQERGYVWSEGGITSPDGHCRAFDAKAAGTVFSSGVGVVVLKRLADALAEGDQIYAVIKGAALNNDGSSKVSFTAPSVDGHAEVIALAQALAGVAPETISYIEAHGTGTPLGDPIEIAGLTQAFRAGTDARAFCRIGSLKTNIGHLDAAAGVAGLIKTALALRRRYIPASLHFTTPNPALELAQSPFVVASEGGAWSRGESPLRAGVSSFGVGGTNAHVVLEEAPALGIRDTFPNAAPQLLVLSARTLRALEDATTRLGKFLRDHPELPLADVTFTLQNGRHAFAHRRFLVADTTAGAAKILLKRERDRVFTTGHDSMPPTFSAEPNDALDALGRRWLAGGEIDWSAHFSTSERRKLSLPTYPFERERFWAAPRKSHSANGATACDPSDGSQASSLIRPTGFQPFEPIAGGQDARASAQAESPSSTGSRELASPLVAPPARIERIAAQVRAMLEELSGSDLSKTALTCSFFELGFDSLFLTQISLAIKSRFDVKVTFRQMLEDLATLQSLVDFLDAKLPTDAPAIVAPALPAPLPASPNGAPPEPVAGGSPLDQMLRQLQTMAGQIETMRAGGGGHAGGAPVITPVKTTGTDDQRFGPFKPIEKGKAGGLTARQQAALDTLVARYNRRTAKSKAYAQQHRAHFCDPRAAGNFRQAWKEMVYPIVCARSLGARIWDIDQNEYVDVTMGFGTNWLGHSPEFVTRAVEEQLKLGVEIGPQTPLAGEAAEMICDLTGFDRAAFCNTGSEAVLAAIRIARTVTGRQKIVYFAGDYHGIFDEVLGRAALVDGEPGATPIAPGIPHIAQAMVLEFDSAQSLETIRAHAHEIAAVLVEPVQSRNPGVQARDFLHGLRQLTREHEIALIFDELITGFRIAPGGAQEYFGIQADIGTYGKILGGGMPIGALAGRRKFMDALDGGMWQFGDCSFPEIGVTFFAGTFVRHPLAIAAAHAVLQHLKAAGPALQREVNERTERFVQRMNAFFDEAQLPMRFQHFSSLFYYDFHPDLKFAGLLFYHLRDRGVHIWEGRVGHLSVAHTDADVEFIIAAFRESIAEMQAGGFLPAADDAAVPGSALVPSAGDGVSPARTLAAVGNGETAGHRTPLESSSRRDAATSTRDACAPRHLPRVGSVDFSVYFFGNYEAAYSADKYDVIIEAAKFADTHGFKAIWIPERHFHPLGGFSPNPAVVAAALARETKQLQLRAGSVALPLHHPVRVAEEWAVVDNLSGGRVGISIASGWHPNDFVFAPQNFEKRRELCYEGFETIRKLWRGEPVEFATGGKNRLAVKLHPMPKQRELPAWLTCIHKDSFIKAGELGMGVLTQTLNNSHEELAEKVAAYRESYARHGHDPAKANVTFLLHTFVAADAEHARELARKPMCDYLRSYLDNSQKRLASTQGAATVDPADVDFLVNRAFEDYVQGKALIGSPETCAKVVAQLHALGADEVGCLLDFGVAPELVLEHLPFLDELRRLANSADSANDAPRRISVPPTQQGLWVVSQFGADAVRAYTEFLTLEFRGPLDAPRLQRALQTLVSRHEALRTTIDSGGETQTVHPSATVPFQLEDVSDLPAVERAERTRFVFEELQKTVLDLAQPPALRTLLLKLDGGHHQLVLAFHHLFGNGPSYWLFLHELCASYDGQTLEPAMQLSEFAAWRSEQLDSAQYRDDEAFWTDEFRDGGTVLELPADRPRPAFASFRGGRARLRIDAELTRRLRETGARHGGSMFMILFAAWQVLLHRLSGQTDITFGVPLESEVRALPGGANLFANTTNVTPLRCRIDPEAPFSALLRQTKTRVLDAREHQEYFFGLLAQTLPPQPDRSRPFLFGTTFNYESAQFSKRAGELEIELITDGVPFRGAPDTTSLELVANIAERDSALHLECDFNIELFDAATIERWLGHFHTLLSAIAADPAQPVARLPMLTAAEREHILVAWNDTACPTSGAPVHELFRAQAARAPERIAAEFEGELMTYAELDTRSETLAIALAKNGIGPGALVGICVDRSLQTLVALLGVLKAGAAYVPLDPAFPKARLQAMCEAAQLAALVTQTHLQPLLPEHCGAVVLLDRTSVAAASSPPFVPSASPPSNPPRVSPADPAYVIFTSGSTGKPKGVQVPHRALTNLLESMRERPGFEETDTLLAITTMSFDMAVPDFFLPLVTGGKAVIAALETASDPRLLMREIERSGATVMQASPATWRLLLAAGWTGSPRLAAWCGAETLPAELATELLPKCAALWNQYGPTETTVWSTCEQIVSAGAPISVGRPISNTQVYVLNDALETQPPGVAGELFIGGLGLADGYLHDLELTARKFVSDPFSKNPAARLYRSGDLARFLPDGRIECLGRSDHQVKVRGFRIETGDVEAALRSHPTVADAVVTARKLSDGDDRLLAHYTARNGQVASERELRRFLGERLPAYMVPGALMLLDNLPRTATGKIDRNALPEISGAPTERRVIAPAATPLQADLLALWQELLGRGEVGIHDDFFELGGHSLLAMKLLSAISAKWRVSLPLRALFDAPTPAGLAGAIESAPREPNANGAPAILPAARRSRRELAPANSDSRA